jgi:hypothetical protein
MVLKGTLSAQPWFYIIFIFFFFFVFFFFFFFYWARCLVPPEVLQPASLLYDPSFGSSRLYRQEPPHIQRRETPVAGKGGNMGEKCPVNFAVK